jgi:hypothetical protein
MSEPNMLDSLKEIDSPAVVVDYKILLGNIKMMSEKAAIHGGDSPLVDSRC